MDELNPTIKERQIYHEMKLTPAMVKSIRTLCGVCLRHYVETKAFKIAIVPNKDRCMETCTVCQGPGVATTTLSCRAESGFHSPAGMR